MPYGDDNEQLERWILAACLMEVTAEKPGNVHPQAAFDDVTYDDFVRSAEVAAPILAQADAVGVGRAMLESVRATKNEVGSNTNLGIILLLAPLAAVPRQLTLADGIQSVLSQLTMDDARNCYAAIRLATPGGLGYAEHADVSDEPTIGLVDAMRLAANRDRVAAQFASEFRDVLKVGVPLLRQVFDLGSWRDSIIWLQLELMAQIPDTLISRKCGRDVATESARQARDVLDSGWPSSTSGRDALHQFNQWLREDGHRRNPGTTADLVAAILFAALREGVINIPSELETQLR